MNNQADSSDIYKKTPPSKVHLNQLLPLLTPILTYCFQQLYFFRHKLLYVSLAMIALLYFYTVKQLAKKSLNNNNWQNHIILPYLFTAGLSLCSILIPNTKLIQSLFFLNLIFISIYFRIIYYYLLEPSKYREGSLENISSYGNFLAFYFVATGIYGLQVYLNLKIWILLLIITFTVSLMVYHVTWVNKIKLKIASFYITLISLVLVELAWSISFLTLSFYVIGLLLAIAYYILIGLVRYYLLKSLDKKHIKLYIIFGFLCISAILLSARWL